MFAKSTMSLSSLLLALLCTFVPEVVCFRRIRRHERSVAETNVGIAKVASVEGADEVAQSNMTGNWRRTILNCATPWTGMKNAAAKRNLNLGQHIASQVEDRIKTEGRVIEQGAEALCGPVSLENIFALTHPDFFAEVVADLFCTGSTRRFLEPVKASRSLLECSYTANSGAHNDNSRLFAFQDPNGVKIHAVDFMFAATIAEHNNRYFSACGGNFGQSKKPKEIKALANLVFPLWKVRQRGSSLKTTLSWATWGQQYLYPRDWDAVVQSVSQGGQAVLFIAEGPKTQMNHFVVLTKVLDGSSTRDKCASRILQDHPACVIWTWGKYFVFESCDNLRKVTGASVEIGLRSPGPKSFAKGSSAESVAVISVKNQFMKRIGGNTADIKSLNPKWDARHTRLDRQVNFVPRVLVDDDEKSNGFQDGQYSECRATKTRASRASPRRRRSPWYR